jgi:anthranilate synthase
MNPHHEEVSPISYTTASGLSVSRTGKAVVAEAAIGELIHKLDTQRGVLLSSGYEYPGRYSRWDMGFANPPLCFTGKGFDFEIEALNERGAILLAAADNCLRGLVADAGVLDGLEQRATKLIGSVRRTTRRFAEEERSRQPSLFTVIRALVAGFGSSKDSHLGLYGAFGYDLCFQFEPVPLHHQRSPAQRDLVLYIPDELTVVDRQREQAVCYRYDFTFGSMSSEGKPRTGAVCEYQAGPETALSSDHAPGEYAQSVRNAKELFRVGDLFELVLSQTFRLNSPRPPSAIFEYLVEHNPAPYALFLNLGEREYLVGASPEMYVRVEGKRCETCPISGTIPRGSNPVEDAEQIRELLISTKDESELTMCTDVDRNDKSRICEAGSVKVLGRRQIELYSRLIHTVDHVEGTLRPEFDALDAFLSHTWAVTVTGAPKPGAIAQVEAKEKSPRAWYGGAIGKIGFDGNLNTGLTLRTVRILDGMAEVRAGATLLFDSIPEAEEQETCVKASAFLEAVRSGVTGKHNAAQRITPRGVGAKVLLVDHNDSFVHTLANYLRQTGASVTTLRAGFDESVLDELKPDLVVLSPGPGSPQEFQLSRTIDFALKRQLPIFGVCLGLQGLVEHFGGSLGVLGYPMHGKPSEIIAQESVLFKDLPTQFTAGRYHSLYAKPETFPAVLKAIAHTADGVIMAIEHRTLPIQAVQFHPESILSMRGDVGLAMLNNAMSSLLGA